MSDAPVQFVAALVFLLGLLVVTASALPPLEKRAGALLGGGFLLAVLGIAIAVLAAVFAR